MTNPAPTVTVTLDDGSDSWDTDISARAHLPSGVSVNSYGRTDEFSQAQSAQLQIVLDNTDGALSKGVATLTNLIPNPSFETDVSHWDVAASCTKAQSATRARFGSHSMKVTGSGVATTNQFITATLSASAGTTYTLSAWIYIPAIATTAPFSDRTLVLYDGTTVGQVTDWASLSIGQWHRQSVSITTSASATGVECRLYTPRGASDVAYWDGVMLTEGSTLHDYFDGSTTDSLGTTYAWTGTANASTSTRTPLPVINVNDPIRLTVAKGSTTVNRFTGKVSGSVLTWPGGVGSLAYLAVTAMDPLTELAGYTMRSLLEEEILALSPSAYYTLGEASGSKTAGDTSGNQAAVLKQVGSGTAVKFGNGTGPVDGLSAVTLSGGKWLQRGSTTPITSPSSLGLMVAFATTATPAVTSEIAYFKGWSLRIDSFGKLDLVATGTLITSTAIVNDGDTHMAAVVWDGTTATLILDGATVDSAAPGVTINGMDALTGGGFPGDDAGSLAFTGTLSHLVTFSTLTVADAETITGYAVDGFAGETTLNRFNRIVGYTGLDSDSTTGMSGQTMSDQATSGQSALEAIQAVADAEGGVVYADGNGIIILQGRYYRAQKTTADLSLSGSTLAVDTGVTNDNQQQVKQVTVTATGGAAQLVGSGLPSQQIDLAVDNDEDALYAAQWIVAKHTDPGSRMGTGSLDLMAPPSGVASEDLLGLEVGDRLDFTDLPDQAWDDSGAVTIEGWTETITDSAWTVAANLLPFSLYTALVLDDTTLGVLDSTDCPLGA